jgi:hypothetical protein
MNYKKPVYPLLNPRGQPYALHPCISIPQTSDSTSNKALGSHGFKRLLLFGIQAHLVEVFVNLGGLSQTIQSIFDGCCKSITMDIIGENRNIIQHRLLSLPTETDSPTVILDDTASEVDDLYSGLQLYYTCRQAALIYSTYVTFPVPRSAAHRDEQLMIIRNAIESSQECGEKQDASAVLLWCAFIGGIVACGSPQQAWYTEQTRNLSARNCIEDWNQLKNFLKSFAWLGAACDIGGHVLWIDMQRDE